MREEKRTCDICGREMEKHHIGKWFNGAEILLWITMPGKPVNEQEVMDICPMCWHDKVEPMLHPSKEKGA
jgi:hypothetical protein